jgi:hypothetical protein
MRRLQSQQQSRVSVFIAASLSIALFGGAALANPAAFERTVDRAAGALFGHGQAEHAQGRRGISNEGGGISLGHGPRSQTTHAPADCLALVEAFGQAAPPSDDPRGIQHAIEVVQAHCQDHPRANGLLRALSRLRANALKHADHGRHEGRLGGAAGGSAAGRAHERGNDSSHGGSADVRSSHGR